MEPSKAGKVTMRRGEQCVTPNGEAVVGIHFGNRVRCDFPDGSRVTFDVSEVIPAQVERPCATVLSFAAARRRTIRPVQ